MQPTSRKVIGQIVHPRGAAPSAAAQPTPFTIEQIVAPRGPEALAAEATVRVDHVVIADPEPLAEA